MAKKRKSPQPISINIAPGELRRTCMENESQIFDMFLSAHQSGGLGGFAAEMVIQSLVESAIHILSTEWYLTFHAEIEKHEKRWREELAEHQEVFTEQFRMAKNALGDGFSKAWDAVINEHNNCAKQNIESGAYAYVIPKFNDDGSHETVGPKDGPYLVPDFKGEP